MFWSWSALSPESFLGKLTHGERQIWIFQKIGREYAIKVAVAVLLTPLIYAMHAAIVRRLKLHPVAVTKR